MNKDQRNFLIERIKKTERGNLDKLEAQRPKHPSLNNYLIAAILDDSIIMKSIDSVREAIRNRVISLGQSDSLIYRDTSWHRHNTEDEDHIHVPADVLFEYPPKYQEALEKYERDLK